MRYLEKYGSFTLGLIISVAFYLYVGVSYRASVELIKQFTTIGTCTFGFLLTLFSLIIQGDNHAINKMRARHKPFLRFINMNKKIVVLSFLLTIYSYFIGYLNLDNVICNEKVVKSLVCLFYGGLFCFVVETIYFLMIFYLLIQGKKEDNHDTM
jgi:hypothetical protein